MYLGLLSNVTLMTVGHAAIFHCHTYATKAKADGVTTLQWPEMVLNSIALAMKLGMPLDTFGALISGLASGMDPSARGTSVVLFFVFSWAILPLCHFTLQAYHKGWFKKQMAASKVGAEEECPTGELSPGATQTQVQLLAWNASPEGGSDKGGGMASS